MRHQDDVQTPTILVVCNHTSLYWNWLSRNYKGGIAKGVTRLTSTRQLDKYTPKDNVLIVGTGNIDHWFTRRIIQAAFKRGFTIRRDQ